MNLSDLVDLEYQLVQDEEARRGTAEARRELEVRDAALGRKVSKDLGMEPGELRAEVGQSRQRRQRVAIAWLSEIRTMGGSLPGRRMAEGLDLLGFVITVLALLLGLSSARAFLGYEGGAPVNAFGFVALFCGLQIALLVGLLFTLTLGRARSGAPRPRRWTRWLARLSRAPWIDRLAGGKRADMEALAGRTLGRTALYRGVEHWLLFGVAQRFGVWFNVGVLATLVYLLTFTDLAFGWSTTFDLRASAFHQFTAALSAPWASWWPGAVPSEDLVRWTQWARDGGGNWVAEMPADQPRPVGAWWSFLVAALLIWGLLPRLIALGVARRAVRRELGGVALDHAAFERLFDRMGAASGHGEWQTPPAASVGSARPRPAPRPSGERAAGLPPRARPATQRRKVAKKPAEPKTEPPPTRVPEAAAQKPAPAPPVKADEPARPVILWGRFAEASDAAASELAKTLGEASSCLLRAGGDLRLEEEGLRTLAAAKARHASVFIEAGVQPTKEVLGFLGRVREQLDPPGSVLVRLVAWDGEGAPAACPSEELEQWQMRLDVEGDLYLRLETV